MHSCIALQTVMLFTLFILEVKFPLSAIDQSSELICGEQEEQETVVLAGHDDDGTRLTVQLWCYWTLEGEALSWGS